jgi:parallel beta-helix repeat protein
MKRTIFLLMWIMVILGILPFAFAEVDSYQYVRVEDRKLMVDFDQDGIYEPFFIKGVGYSPFPIGRHPSDWGPNIFDDTDILNRDFDLLQAMNVNTIRIWKGDDTESAGRFKVKLTTKTLDLAQQHGIRVIAGFWIQSSGAECISGQRVYHVPDFTNRSVRDDIKQRFENYVNTFKNHPAILFWAIGNENNLHFNPDDNANIQAWFSLAEEMAQVAHNSEGATFHPVALVNGDLGYIGDALLGASDAQLSNLDIWGANVYRGYTFGSLFSDFSDKTSKPLWISEYGIDAWHTNSYTTPSDGYEDQATQAQWDVLLWDEIVHHNDITVGATIMSYSDEWWKPYEWMDGGIHNSEQNHFGSGPTDTDCPPDAVVDWYPASPDNFFNQEWWGIMAISRPSPDTGGVDIMTPRLAYDTLRDKFSRGPTFVFGDVGNQNWNAAGSPYIVTDILTIPSGTTLTIQPGVEIRFDGYYALDVQGTLNATGSPNSRILFTSNKTNRQRGDWFGIFLGPTSTNSVIRNATIEYAESAVAEGSTHSPRNLISNCIIRFNNTGFDIESDGNAEIANNDILYNRYYGIELEYSGPVLIRNNIVAFNEGSGIGGFYHSAPTIKYNDIWLNILNYNGVSPGAGDISQDPRFMNPTVEDYHLRANSPAIDRGDPNSPKDPDNSRADIGAYYYHHSGGCPPKRPCMAQYNDF